MAIALANKAAAPGNRAWRETAHAALSNKSAIKAGLAADIMTVNLSNLPLTERPQ
jgi:hypothetical protein